MRRGQHPTARPIWCWWNRPTAPPPRAGGLQDVWEAGHAGRRGRRQRAAAGVRPAHKTQALIFVINRLKAEGVIDPRVPVFSDSSTAKEVTKLYHRYEAYYHGEAKQFGEPFYRSRYFEVGVAESLNTHGKEPAVYVASSGMLDHAAAPKHLWKMASDPKNAP